MHTPKHTLLFGLLLFLCLGLLSFSFPERGITILPGVNLEFPSLGKLFEISSSKDEVNSILKTIDEIDTSFVVHAEEEPTVHDTIEQPMETPEVEISYGKSDAPPKLNTAIQCRNGKPLSSFFVALKNIKNNTRTIRVLHYGDSQIEGDRITDYLRLKLQGQFGGKGPGLISAMPISQSVINRIETASGWDRYGTYTAKDKRVKHTNYGVLAGFCRFSSYKKTYDTSVTLSTSLGIVTTKLGGANALNFNRIKLFYGGAQRKTWCEYYEGAALMGADSLKEGGDFNVKEYKVTNGANKLVLKFKAKDSPDFYALSLEGDNGVMVDNIALRGSSGTFFHQINLLQLKTFYDYLNVKLIILQFGGNVMPSIEDKAMAVNYGNYLRYQLGLVKKAAPQASILFIGPADMSIKEGTDYITYPLLETVRDEIKSAVLESGCAFFDLYDCMGGKNSMSTWVDLRLAASDYIHFSPQGARKMATMLYSEIINEYNKFLKTNK